ncbi:MAG: hypothetical protein GY801_25220 [bacterium]|nr:hypothetical protein [bacterium]
MKNTSYFTLSAPPTSWERPGRIIEKGSDGSYDANVTGYREACLEIGQQYP